MQKMLTLYVFCITIIITEVVCVVGLYVEEKRGYEYESIVGDPGMKSDKLRVALEEWNFCNEVGQEAPGMGSPRQADCADVFCPLLTDPVGGCLYGKENGCTVNQKVTEVDNKLGSGDRFPNISFESQSNPDKYAMEKELYLGSLCEVRNSSNPWQFWMIMLKNGNFDTRSGLCPENGRKVSPIITNRTFPCFGKGCMNQPLVYHNWTKPQENAIYSCDSQSPSIMGSFYGTYDLDASLGARIDDISYFSVVWEKQASTGRWVFSHKLKTSKKYPWLMLYLRADAAKGFSGGYHYDTRGMMLKLPESPNFKVRLTLNVISGGGSNSQFYLIDIGSCWKNDGQPCDGEVETDVTRYSEMIINPEVTSWCRPDNLAVCPPYHINSNGSKVYRNDTARFPYSAYHLYCAPGNAKYLEVPFDLCDPYSNPQPQELVQLLPHPEWAIHGYPAHKGEGWIEDPRTWELDVGALSSRLYFYQDPGTPPAKRLWSSIDVGTEVYISGSDEIAEWTVSDFDVIIPKGSVFL
jgi:hypothetical protein